MRWVVLRGDDLFDTDSMKTIYQDASLSRYFVGRDFEEMKTKILLAFFRAKKPKAHSSKDLGFIRA